MRNCMFKKANGERCKNPVHAGNGPFCHLKAHAKSEQAAEYERGVQKVVRTTLNQEEQQSLLALIRKELIQ